MSERHPVQERPDLPVEERCRLLEVLVAQLWDCCWWLSLDPVQRRAYEAQGFTNPMRDFSRERES